MSINPAPRPAAGHRSLRALIVEDDPLFATVYKETLTSAAPGIQIELAANGYLALMSLKTHLPDLIVLDLHMPGLDGVAFLSILKRKDCLLEVPVFVVSSADAEVMAPLRALPHVHVFAKPIRPALLRQLARQTLAESIDSRTSQDEPRHLLHSKLTAFVGGNPTLQREIARQFYELTPDRIARLEHCVQQRDLHSLREWCHTLIGTSSMIGAQNLHDQVNTLRDYVDAKDADGIVRQVAAIATELRQIAVMLANEFDLYDEKS